MILPFWSLLMLLWCKMLLDQNLQATLEALQELRRQLMRPVDPLSPGDGGDSNSSRVLGVPKVGKDGQETTDREERIAHEAEDAVSSVSNFIILHQDSFMLVWTHTCCATVKWAARLLWVGVYCAILLVSYMFWIWLDDRVGVQHNAHRLFFGVCAAGLVLPMAFAFRWRCLDLAQATASLTSSVDAAACDSCAYVTDSNEISDVSVTSTDQDDEQVPPFTHTSELATHRLGGRSSYTLNTGPKRRLLGDPSGLTPGGRPAMAQITEEPAST